MMFIRRERAADGLCDRGGGILYLKWWIFHFKTMMNFAFKTWQGGWNVSDKWPLDPRAGTARNYDFMLKDDVFLLRNHVFLLRNHDFMLRNHDFMSMNHVFPLRNVRRILEQAILFTHYESTDRLTIDEFKETAGAVWADLWLVFDRSLTEFMSALMSDWYSTDLDWILTDFRSVFDPKGCHIRVWKVAWCRPGASFDWSSTGFRLIFD